MLIRPIASSDVDDLFKLAQSAGTGVTTLPADRKILSERISLSENSFQNEIEPERANYLFALEDEKRKRVVGVSGIEAHVGVSDVWYNYRLEQAVNASRELNIYTRNQTLSLSNELTGSTEICSLFLDDAYRNSANGRFLSKVRFLFMRDFTNRFSSKVFAEMRGLSDASGRSPFWEGLGRHFFNMDFSRADYLSAQGDKSFVAELMPKYPIYVAFLNAEAQAAIGQVHDYTRPALKLLQAEGFNFNGFVDIFDAGPIVESFLTNIRAVRESQLRLTNIVNKHRPAQDEPKPFIVSNGRLDDFRALLVDENGSRTESINLTQYEADILGVGSNDPLRVVPLRYAS